MKRIPICALSLYLLTNTIFTMESSVPVEFGQLMSISGVLIDFNANKGIPNAVVSLSDLNWVLTKSDGTFIFSEVPAGIYEIEIDKTVCSIPGYYVPHEVPDSIEVKKGKNVKNVRIQLKKGMEIPGQAYSQDGRTPLRNVKITLYSDFTDLYAKISGSYSHSPTTHSPFDFFSDENGKFVIKGIMSGIPFNLVADANGYAFERMDEAIRSEDGSKNGIDFVFGRKSASILQGRIVSEKNIPIQNAKVCLNGMGEASREGGTCITDSNGAFSIIGLPLGTYRAVMIPSKSDEGKFDFVDSFIDTIINVNREDVISTTIILKDREPDQNSVL